MNVKTRAVHSRKEAFDVYIGRPSKFGNPFVIGRDGDRSEVIAKYRDLFKVMVSTVPAFRKELRKLKGKRLGCFCAPLGCHGDIIAEYVNNME